MLCDSLLKRNRLQEHDSGISSVNFSHDEVCLASPCYSYDVSPIETVGHAWFSRSSHGDMGYGNVCFRMQKHMFMFVQGLHCIQGPAGSASDNDRSVCRNGARWVHFFAICVMVTPFWTDVKRRDTTSYQLVTAGTQQLKVLALDPYAGDVKSERVCDIVCTFRSCCSPSLRGVQMSTGTAVRDYSALAFSPDYQLLFAGSTSGDVSVLSIKFKNLVSTIPACSGGVRALYALKTGGVVIGGGDGSIRVFGGDPQVHG